MAEKQHEFAPHPLLRGPHAQTIAGKFWRRKLRHATRLFAAGRDVVEVERGTRVLMRTTFLADRERRPTLLLVHGLEGSAEAGYMLGTADKALSEGWNVARLNLRNCGGTEELTTTLYHSGLTADVEAALRWLRAEGCPRVALCGFSLGGNVALKLAGEYGAAASSLHAVVAVSAAVDLAAAAARLEKPENYVYQRFFLHGLTRRVARKGRILPERYDERRLRGLRSVREFDERFTAPAFGFRNASDYYERASARSLLAAIRVPTLLLHAEDDPIVPMTERVRAAAMENPAIRVVTTRRGGHCGFVGRPTAHEDVHWAENRALDFVLEALDAPSRFARRSELQTART